MAFDALILDFGEVLVEPQDPAGIERMARLASLPVVEFSRRYWVHRDAYDSGLSAGECWRRVIDGASLVPAEAARVVDALSRADCDSWTLYRDDVWAVASAFKAAGGRTAILSNGPPEVINRVRTERPIDRYFDIVIVSCEVGCAKPDPAIYLLCLDRLGVRAESALFVDDRPVNLEAARRLGLQTLHFTGSDSVAALRARIDSTSGTKVAKTVEKGSDPL
jgi:putative hydrolase of the HAD superfamily